MYLFVYLFIFGCTGSSLQPAGSLVAARGTFSCGMQDLVPKQGSNPGPLHSEHEVLPTEPPEKSPLGVLK